MSTVAEQQMQRSADFFEHSVWPAIEAECGGGRLIRVETVTDNEFAVLLDRLAGIDFWRVFEGIGIDGIASRVQWAEQPWGTFTVRRSIRSGGSTEYQKRVAAREHDLLKPAVVCQAYASTRTGNLMQVGIADMYEVIDACSEDRWRTNRADGHTFYWVPFETVSNIRVFNFGKNIFGWSGK